MVGCGMGVKTLVASKTHVIYLAEVLNYDIHPSFFMQAQNLIIVFIQLDLSARLSLFVVSSF